MWDAEWAISCERGRGPKYPQQQHPINTRGQSKEEKVVVGLHGARTGPCHGMDTATRRLACSQVRGEWAGGYGVGETKRWINDGELNKVVPTQCLLYIIIDYNHHRCAVDDGGWQCTLPTPQIMTVMLIMYVRDYGIPWPTPYYSSPEVLSCWYLATWHLALLPGSSLQATPWAGLSC
jgi:hypothetical protein